MSSLFLHSPQPAASRRTVRIVRHKGIPPSAMISLIVATAVVLWIFVAWRLLRTERVAPLHYRTVSEIQLEWKCEVGHSFQAAGQSEPRQCLTPKCDQLANPVTAYVCPLHGSFPAQVRFGSLPDGATRVSEIRLENYDWVSVEKGVLCPHCSRALRSRSKDPLDAIRRARSRPGR